MTEAEMIQLAYDEGFAAAIELAGAGVVGYDSSSAEPLLVRYKLGKGWVYTLTFWAYPGHEIYFLFVLCEKATDESATGLSRAYHCYFHVVFLFCFLKAFCLLVVSS